ncbi:MAG: serine/threonine-protein kinase [Acidobacteriota bacterium]
MGSRVTLPSQVALRGVRARLRIVSLSLAGLWIMTAAGVLVLLWVEGSLELARTPLLWIAALIGLSLALWAAAGWQRLSEHALTHIGHAVLPVACAFTAKFHVAYENHSFGLVTPFGPHVLVAALFPLVLLSPPGRTAWISALAAGAGLLAIISSEATQGIPIPIQFLPDYLAAAAISPVVAWVLARNIGRLRARMEELRSLGSYRLEQKIGEGGMGEVWRATHQLLARPTAIKRIGRRHLRGDQTQRDLMLERFSREARATAALTSMNTVDLYDFGVTEDGTVFIAMELLDGVDLRHLVLRHGRQPADRVRRILLQACDSLAEAHSRGLVHRDIKPANLMLCRQGQRTDVVKVLDFGIVGLAEPPAAAVDESQAADLTLPGSVLGTPAFLAPEVLSGGVSGPRSDLYALGATAYWLLTADLPFVANGPLQMAAAILRDEPEPPSVRGAAVASELEAIVLRCLAKDSADRFASADALAAALEACPDRGTWSSDAERIWWHRHTDLEAATEAGDEGGPAALATETMAPPAEATGGTTRLG